MKGCKNSRKIKGILYLFAKGPKSAKGIKEILLNGYYRHTQCRKNSQSTCRYGKRIRPKILYIYSYML